MFCPNCASEVKPDLNYCNTCGYRLPTEEVSDNSSIAGSLTKAVGFVGVIGLVSAIVLVKVLLASNIATDALVVIVGLYLATVFGICALSLKYLKALLPTVSSSFEPRMPKGLKSHDTAQLEPPKSAPASVVENTTRTLEKVQLERD